MGNTVTSWFMKMTYSCTKCESASGPTDKLPICKNVQLNTVLLPLMALQKHLMGDLNVGRVLGAFNASLIGSTS